MGRTAIQKRIFIFLFLVFTFLSYSTFAEAALQFLPRYQGGYGSRTQEGGREAFSGACDESSYPYTAEEAKARNCNLSGDFCEDFHGVKHYQKCLQKTCQQLDYYCLFTAAEKSSVASKYPDVVWTEVNADTAEKCYRAGCPLSWSSVSRCQSYNDVIKGSGVKSVKSCLSTDGLNSKGATGNYGCIADERYTLTCNPGYIRETDYWVTGSSDVCETCVKCPAGYKCDGTNKIQCPAGTQASNDGTECIKCGVAYANPVPGGVCEVCQRGEYSDKEGATECTPCPIGSFKRTGAVCKDCSSIDGAENLPGASVGADRFSKGCRCRSGYTWNGSESVPKCTRPDCTAVSCTGSTSCGGKSCVIFKTTAIKTASELGTGVGAYASCTPTNCDGDNYQYGYLVTGCSDGYALSGGSCAKKTCEQYNADYLTKQPDGYQCTSKTIANGNVCYVKSSCEKIISEICPTGWAFNGKTCVSFSSIRETFRFEGENYALNLKQTRYFGLKEDNETRFLTFMGNGYGPISSFSDGSNILALAVSLDSSRGLDLSAQQAYWTAFQADVFGPSGNSVNGCSSVASGIVLSLPSLTFSVMGGAIAFLDVNVGDLTLNGPVAIGNAEINAENIYINGSVYLTASVINAKNIYVGSAGNIIIGNGDKRLNYKQYDYCYPEEPVQRDVLITADNIYYTGDSSAMPSVFLISEQNEGMVVSGTMLKLEVVNNVREPVFSELSVGREKSGELLLPIDEYKVDLSVGMFEGWRTALFKRVHVGYTDPWEDNRPDADIIFRSATENSVCSAAKKDMYVSKGDEYTKDENFITCKKLDCLNISCEELNLFGINDYPLTDMKCSEEQKYMDCQRSSKDVCEMGEAEYLNVCSERSIVCKVEDISNVCELGTLSCYDCNFNPCYETGSNSEDNYCSGDINKYWGDKSQSADNVYCVSSDDAGTSDINEACEILKEKNGVSKVIDTKSFDYGSKKCFSCIMIE